LEKILSPGRRIWHTVRMRDDGIGPFVVGPKIVVGQLKFFPAGAYEKDGHLIDRKRSLIQIYTDPGGTQTLAVADIHLKDPRKAKK
jgi:hypothetical protein